MNSMEFFKEKDLFARHVGLNLLEAAPGHAVVELQIQDHHLNGVNTVHGGALFTLADFAFAVASNSHGQVAMGISTSMNFIRSAQTGDLVRAVAKELARGPKLASYHVTITDQDHHTLALFQGMVYIKKDSY